MMLRGNTTNTHSAMMRNSVITDFFQAIKPEPVFENEPFDTSSFYEYDTAIKDEPEYYIKEELDEQYEEDNTDLYNSFNCTVVIERLSDSDLQKYLRNAITSAETNERSDIPTSLDVVNTQNSYTNSKQEEIATNNVNNNVRDQESVETLKRSDSSNDLIDVVSVENSDTNSKQKELVENNVDENVRNQESIETIKRCDSLTDLIDVETVDNSDTNSMQKDIVENNVDENVSSQESIETIKRCDSSTNSMPKEIIENNVERNVRTRRSKDSQITTFFTVLPKENLQNMDTNNEQNETIENNSTNKPKVQFKYKERDVIFNTKCYFSICLKCNKKNAAKTTVSECQDCGDRLVYKCKKCGKQLGSHLGIGHHIKRECTDEGFYYECHTCIYRSSIKYYVVNHIKRMHPDSICLDRIRRIKSKKLRADLTAVYEKCLKCGHRFRDLESLKAHDVICKATNDEEVENKNETQKISSEYLDSKGMMIRYCTNCNEEVSMKELNSMQDKKLCIKCQIPLAYRCLVCQKPYNSCNGIVGHIVQYHADREELTCSKCDFKSTSLTYLKCHYKRMHDPNIYGCPRCRKLYKSQETLSRHKFMCGKQPHLYCDHCSYKTFIRKYLKRHLFNVHPLHDTSVACPKCSKVLKNKQTLKEHLYRVHTRMADIYCHHCTFTTKSKYHVQRHIFRCHMAGSKYECHRCKYQFRTHDTLKRHKNMCSIERHIHCELCQYKTHKMKLLKDHIRNIHLKKKQ